MRFLTVEIMDNVKRAIAQSGRSINATARAMPGQYTTNRRWLIRFLGGYIGKPRPDRFRDLAEALASFDGATTYESLVGKEYRGSNAGPRRSAPAHG